MANWQFDGGPVVIGLDVGWSVAKKSCAIAVEGLTVPKNESSWKAYDGRDRPLAVGLFRYCDLLTQIPRVFAAFGNGPHCGIAVLDGPIGPHGQPIRNRSVDGEFTRGEFNGRMQPSPVEGGTGRRYTEVTDRIAQALFNAAGVNYHAGLWNGAGVTNQFCVCETHPTVGLALLLPQQDVATLPSRKRPRRITIATDAYGADDSPFVKAKSDWYWQVGACRWIAEEALCCPSVVRETHHERIAGLYCLAVAKLLSADPGRVVAVGADDGVYVIPAAVDQSWKVGLNRVGILRGTLAPADHTGFLLATNVPAVTVANIAVGDDVVNGDGDESEKGDETDLILNDPGGIWVKQNDWLECLEPPVIIQALDMLEGPFSLRLGNRPDGTLWCPDAKEHTTLKLARRRPGFNGKHLAKTNAFKIPVKVLSSGPWKDAELTASDPGNLWCKNNDWMDKKRCEGWKLLIRILDEEDQPILHFVPFDQMGVQQGGMKPEDSDPNRELWKSLAGGATASTPQKHRVQFMYVPLLPN